jgi:hypothetical protein
MVRDLSWVGKLAQRPDVLRILNRLCRRIDVVITATE